MAETLIVMGYNKDFYMFDSNFLGEEILTIVVWYNMVYLKHNTFKCEATF